jgi:probable F420-dependent oxidoreductase
MRAYLDAMEVARFNAPEARAPGPPLVVAALGPKMLGLARDRTQGAHSYLVTPEHTQRAREILGADKILAVEQGVVLTTDRDVGLARGRRHLETYKSLPNYRNSWLRLGFTEAETEGELSDRLVEALVVWGDEGTIAARVAEHREAGADHVCVQVFGEQPSGLALSDLRHLAPALTDAAGERRRRPLARSRRRALLERCLIMRMIGPTVPAARGQHSWRPQDQ